MKTILPNKLFLSFVLGFLLLNNLQTFAQQTWTSNQTGNWTDSTIWTTSGGATGAPPFTLGTNQVVEIQNGHEVTLVSGTVVLQNNANLSITQGGQLNLNNGSFRLDQGSTSQFNIEDAGLFVDLDIEVFDGEVNWDNALVYAGNNYNFTRGTNHTILNSCLQAANDMIFQGNNTVTVDVDDSYMLVGIDQNGNGLSSGNITIKGQGTTFDVSGTVMRSIASSGIILFEQATMNGDITAAGTSGEIKVQQMSGTTSLDNYCAGNGTSGFGYFSNNPVQDCNLVDTLSCGSGSDVSFYDINGSVKNGSLASGTGQGIFDGTQMYVSLLNELDEIIKTATVSSNGNYSFDDHFPSDYSTVLHTSSSGSSTPAEPSGFDFNGEDPNGTISNDGISSFEITNSNISSDFTLNDPDKDSDGIIDSNDLDDDNDGILDTDESGGVDPLADADNDGTPNFEDADNAGFVDVNNDDIDDNFDTDLDGVINAFDKDSDNDGIPDVTEAGGVDADGDGVIDNFTDTDNDGLDDTIGASGLGIVDTDGDGIANSEDLDSDNDGTPDVIESGGLDADNDGIQDDLTDTDNDGFADPVDGDVGNDGTAENTSNTLLPTGTDANGDGLADDYPNGGDFDGEGILNRNDLDSDGDGILDTQETGAPDTNNDGIADGTDGVGNGWNDSVDPGEGGTAPSPGNTDGTGEADYLDIDSDDDGIPDNIEGQATSSYTASSGTDADNDGIDNVYDNDTATYGGNTNNGVTPENTDGTDDPDYLDSDTDNDGVSDIEENGDTDNTLAGTDSDGDGLDDNFDDVADTTGSPLDVNDNINTPDASTLGDEDGDLGSGGDVDYRDILEPKANNIAFETPEETTLNGDVSTNDGDIQTGSDYSVMNSPANGTLTFNNDGTFTYTPNSGFTGTDTFEYEVCLPSPNQTVCDQATATIAVIPDISCPAQSNSFDWDDTPDKDWNSGDLTNSYTNNGTSFDFTVTPPAGATGMVGGSPVNAQFFQGGLPSVENQLVLAALATDLETDEVTLTLDIGPQGIGLEGVVFSLFDVDGTNNGNIYYREEVSINGSLNGSAVNPVILAKNIHNVTGNTVLSDAISATNTGANSDLGTVDVYFEDFVDQITITFKIAQGDSPGPGSAPGISLHDISYCEIEPFVQTVSGDFDNVNNWQGGIVPNQNVDASIDDGVTSTVTQDQAVNNLTLDPGSVAEIDGTFTLNIKGDLTNNGDFDGAGYVVFDGASAQSIDGDGTDAGSFTNIRVNNAAGVTLTDNADLFETLDLDNGDFNIQSGDFLTFKSDASGTAVLSEVASGSTVSGCVIVERYIPASNRAFRYTAASVNTTVTCGKETIRDNIQEGNSVSNIDDYTGTSETPGFGTHVTGSTVGANGFDATITGNPSMFSWDESTQQWGSVPNTDTQSFNVGDPYSLLVRGGRELDLRVNNFQLGSETTLRFTGELETGNVSVNNLASGLDEFSLVANPYQAQVDMKALLESTDANNLSSSFMYIYDPTLGTRGAYATVDLTTTNGSSTPSGSEANKFLQPNQAFFIKNTAASPSLTFKETYKKAVDQNLTNETFSIDQTSVITANLKRAHNNSFKLVDGIKIMLNQNFDNSVLNNDAPKFWNSDESIAIEHNNNWLAVERRQIPVTNESIQLFIWDYKNTDYQLELKLGNLEQTQVKLKDHYTNDIVELPTSQAFTYNFTANSSIPESVSNTRFELIFEQVSLNTSELTENNISVYPNPATDILHIDIPQIAGQEVTLELVDMAGRQISKETLTAQTNTISRKAVRNLSSGVYNVNIQFNGNSFNKKIIVK